MITTSGLNHLALPVKDPQRSAEFYTGLFNMEVTAFARAFRFRLRLSPARVPDLLQLQDEASLSSLSERIQMVHARARHVVDVASHQRQAVNYRRRGQETIDDG